MKTIEERAEIIYKGNTIEEDAYKIGAGEQKQLILKAFDKWLCKHSWITRDENNRQPLAELRDIIENI